MKRIIILSVLVVALTATAVSFARHPGAQTARYSCGLIHARGTALRVSVTQGHLACRSAQHVMRAFMRGRGKEHGPRNGPAYKQYWTLPGGWSCGYGAGGGACRRHHVRLLALVGHG